MKTKQNKQQYTKTKQKQNRQKNHTWTPCQNQTDNLEMLRKSNEQSPFNCSSFGSKALAQAALPVCYTGNFIAFSSQ